MKKAAKILIPILVVLLIGGIIGGYVAYNLTYHPSKWLAEGETARWADDLIYGSMLAKDGIIDGALAAYCRRRMSADTDLTRLVWNILMAEQWYRGYVISRSRIPG